MGSYFAVFRSVFVLAGGRSESLPRALVRHALRPFAPFATVSLRRWVDECNERFKTGHVRPSFFRRATAPLTFRGRGALGVGVLFFYYIIFYSRVLFYPYGPIFVCTGVQGIVAFRTTQVDDLHTV